MVEKPKAAKRPRRVPIKGDAVRLEPISASAHGKNLWPLVSAPEERFIYDYITTGPWKNYPSFEAHLKRWEKAGDELFYAIVERASGKAVGWGAYLRIKPQHAVIEIGHLLFTKPLRRTRGATEACYLLLRHAFDDLGYRRVEWKCDARNRASRRAAERLGFAFEGIFKSHMVVRDGIRDTAWYAMLDHEWPAIKKALEAWLAPANFDREGRQKEKLSEFLGSNP